jgi:hypothetical protein
LAERSSGWKALVGDIQPKDLILPAAVLIGGAVIGRLVGVKALLRGATAVLALAAAVKDAGVIDPEAFHRRRGGSSGRKSTGRAVEQSPRGSSHHKAVGATARGIGA